MGLVNRRVNGKDEWARGWACEWVNEMNRKGKWGMSGTIE